MPIEGLSLRESGLAEYDGVGFRIYGPFRRLLNVCMDCHDQPDSGECASDSRWADTAGIRYWPGTPPNDMLSGSRLSLDEGTGTMLDLGLLGVILGKELTSPEGKKEVIRFLTSPEGMAILEEFFRSPDARPLAGNLLMPIPGNLGVPDPVRQSMQQYIPK